MSRDQIAYRTDSNLISRLDALAERMGYSRNQLMDTILQAGVAALEKWGVPADVVGEAVVAALESGEFTEIPGQISIEHTDNAQVSDGVTVSNRHFHRYTEQAGPVEYSKGVGYALYRCSCGQTHTQKVPVRP